MRPRKASVASAIAELDRVGGYGPRRKSPPTPQQEALDRAAIYRDAMIPGSIAHIESPRPDEADIASVLVVSSGGRLTRIALGRNRTANLIQQLVASLV